MFRSKNMVDWEPYKIAIITDDLDRLETAQVWEHNGKWYMSFGGCYVDPEKGGFANLWNDNFVYMADSFDGPYEKQAWSRLEYKDASHRPYIQKQIKDPFGDDVMLASAPYEGVLWPYKIVYAENGSISLEPIGSWVYSPRSQRLCATLDAVCFALCCVTHNARGAIFTDSLTSVACRLALCRLSGAGNNPMVGMTVAVAVAIEEACK